MPDKCCVPGCKSNYEVERKVVNYVSVFRIKSECKGDELKLESWLRKIPRENLTVSDQTVICIKHFSPQFIITHDSATRPDGTVVTAQRKVPKLTRDAYPSLFENCPAYLSSEPPAKRRNPADRLSDRDQRDAAAFDEWMHNDRITTYEQLTQNAAQHLNGPWKCECVQDSIFFYILHVVDDVLCVKTS